MRLAGAGALMVAAVMMTPMAVAHDHAAAMPTAHCLGLPTKKVAIQTYVFMGDLAGLRLPADADNLPPMKKFGQLGSLFTPGGAPKPSSEKVEALFRAIRGIGYRNIESSPATNGFSADVHAAMLKRAGLHAVASHEPLDKATWPATLAKAKANGQMFIGSGDFGRPGLSSLERTLETARTLNELGKSAADQGLKFYVHNHTGEFSSRFLYDRGDGKPVMTSAWEIVAANTDPRYVHFEIDVYWARLAFKPENFEELLGFIRKYRGRISLLHMKDMAGNGAITDLGAGTTDWRRVVDAAGPSIQYYIFEFDFPVDPMRSARIGFDYLTCGGKLKSR